MSGHTGLYDICDGSTRGGQVQTQDISYASCVEQTSLCLFYSICALESLIAYGADTSNTIAEAPPPKQRDLGFFSTLAHEPYIYRITIKGKRILILRQVDDFDIGASNEETYHLFCDALDSSLKATLKHEGPITDYNGIDVEQTPDYINLSSSTYLRKILTDQQWDSGKPPSDRPIPVSGDSTYLRSLDEATGPATDATRQQLAMRMGFSYPELHYIAIKTVFRYLRTTVYYDLYYWRVKPLTQLPYSTSSPEAKLLTASDAAKMALYIRARHLDIRHFALLDWVEQDLIHLSPISTTINGSNAMTKLTQSHSVTPSFSFLHSNPIDFILFISLSRLHPSVGGGVGVTSPE